MKRFIVQVVVGNTYEVKVTENTIERAEATALQYATEYGELVEAGRAVLAIEELPEEQPESSSQIATIYTGCQNCDHEAEFHGVVLEDIAYFPCLSCQTVFTLGTIDGWSNFFDEDEEEN
jgi:hypothetical protein